MTSYIKIKFFNHVVRIKFFDEKKNSFTSEQLENLKNTITDLENNPEITVIILESEGNSVFCSGASFDELLAVSNAEQGKSFFSGFANVILAMKNSSKLIIGNVKGKAIGGGVGLIAACDYVLATNNASLKLSELAIGIGPFVIEPAVSKKIGKTAMAELALNPTEWKTAEWALQKGLYSEVFNHATDLENYLSSYAQALSLYNPEALLEMKKILWENTTDWETLLAQRAAISGKLVLSEFTKNALQKFKNK
ncbi:enoyl-CoA hydratase/isomerase family protein [Flavobacterium agricola]|uniref:Enoyl-CoA hydratase/isomerase family protein n=1 Tax=Flavobacterium agricola TaxID=2870839 RepID=A0ABY6LXZ6_9FLAO|nr:enoyl-CoA hydratase/isomerase family protein [Flavobacterium agricola]UYW01181.1 enoyl-CoA hydratase/isomerase family protein [Flavobacterium agricola]